MQIIHNDFRWASAVQAGAFQAVVAAANDAGADKLYFTFSQSTHSVYFCAVRGDKIWEGRASDHGRSGQKRVSRADWKIYDIFANDFDALAAEAAQALAA